MRTKNGHHQVDLTVERRDGRVLAIEVKLAALPEDLDVRHLHWLANQIGDDLVDSLVVTAATLPAAVMRRLGHLAGDGHPGPVVGTTGRRGARIWASRTWASRGRARRNP